MYHLNQTAPYILKNRETCCIYIVLVQQMLCKITLYKSDVLSTGALKVCSTTLLVKLERNSTLNMLLSQFVLFHFFPQTSSLFPRCSRQCL